MKGLATVFLAGMALVAVAKDLTLSIDTTAPKRNAFPCDVPYLLGRRGGGTRLSAGGSMAFPYDALRRRDA